MDIDMAPEFVSVFAQAGTANLYCLAREPELYGGYSLIESSLTDDIY